MKIESEKFVSLIYDLNVDEDKTELMERVTKDRPLNFLFGMGMMLDAFESNIAGLQPGDKFSFVLQPSEAYGEYFSDRVIKLAKSIFEIDGKFDDERVKEGETLHMMDAEGNRLMGAVLEITDDQVVMDFNHPLAGETLYFDGEVIEVRDATQEDVAAFTHGSGCDCSSCNDECEDKQ